MCFIIRRPPLPSAPSANTRFAGGTAPKPGDSETSGNGVGVSESPRAASCPGPAVSPQSHCCCTCLIFIAAYTTKPRTRMSSVCQPNFCELSTIPEAATDA